MQQQITLPVACQFADRVLVMMKQWLEEKKDKLNEHPERTDEAIKSCHHARLLIGVYLREMIAKEQMKSQK